MFVPVVAANEFAKNTIVARNTLNKVKTTNITGYSQNPIEYTGTCVFSVKHNNVTRNMLFFVTNVDDTIVFFANSFAATAGTNTRNTTFKIVHSGLL